MQPSPGTHFRWILILLVPVVAGTVFLFNNPYNYSFYPSSLFFSAYAFLVLPLATIEWYYAYSGRARTRKLVLLFSSGILATVGSAFHTTLLAAPGPCNVGVSGGGFPLPWYLNFMFYMGRGPVPLCPLFYNPPWGLFASFSFLFDTIFYAAFAIAGNEFYRWVKGQNTLTRQSKPGSKGALG